jgi:HK97 family phage major capsid protein
MAKVADLKNTRGEIWDQRNAIVKAAEEADRDLNEAEQTQFSQLGEQYDALTNRIERFESLGVDPVAAEAPQRRTAPDSPTRVTGVREMSADDPKFGFKNQRDFFQSVKSAGMGYTTDKRLAPLRQTAGSDEASGSSDPYGGFLIPKAFSQDTLTIEFEGDPTVGRTRAVPMTSPSVSFNARVDTSHATSVSGGLRVYRRSETASVTASRMQLKQVELKANALMGVSYGTNELLADSAPSWLALLQSSYRGEFQSRRLNEIIRGTGVGEYEGFLNSASLVTVSKETSQVADSVVTANILKMRSRVWGYERSVWLANPDTLPQLAQLSFNIGIAGSPAYQFSMSEDVPDRLMGRPIFYTDHMSTVGDAGDIACVNLSEYLEGEYEPMQEAESMHVRFVEHETAFKFWTRNDGRSWWTSALTPKKGTNTRSPFVTLAARA